MPRLVKSAPGSFWRGTQKTEKGLPFCRRMSRLGQYRAAESTGTSGAYVSRLIDHPEEIANKTFLTTMDELGYDVQLTYDKRDTAG